MKFYESKERLKVIDSVNLLSAKSNQCMRAGNTKGGSITVPLTSCLTGLN